MSSDFPLHRKRRSNVLLGCAEHRGTRKADDGTGVVLLTFMSKDEPKVPGAPDIWSLASDPMSVHSPAPLASR
eukprot:3820800-Prorocentrum_lima.AAC.1